MMFVLAWTVIVVVAIITLVVICSTLVEAPELIMIALAVPLVLFFVWAVNTVTK